MALLLGRDAHAGVTHRQLQPALAGASQGRRQRPDGERDATAGGVLDRIAQQVAQQLAQPQRIEHSGIGQAGLQHEREIQAARVGRQAVLGADLAQHRRQRHRCRLQPHPAGLEAGQVEHIVDQLHQRVDGLLGQLPALALGPIQRPGTQPVQRQQDDLQRRPQLVAGGGHEQVLGLHRVQQAGLQLALGGHVHQVAGPGHPAVGQGLGPRLAMQPARAGQRVLVAKALFEGQAGGQAVGLGLGQHPGVGRVQALRHQAGQVGLGQRAGAEKGLGRLAQVVLDQPPVGPDHAPEHHPGQAAGHRAQPLLGQATGPGFAQQAAHPPGAQAGQRQQRQRGGGQPGQVALPGKAGPDLHRHPAPVEALAFELGDVGQRAVDQRHHGRGLARCRKVELHRDLIDPRHLAQQAVVVGGDAQVGIQLGLDRRIGLAGGHPVHCAGAGRRVDDLDVGVAAGHELAQGVLRGQRQALAAQAGQVPIHGGIAAGDDVVGHLQVGVAEGEILGPLGRAAQQGHQVDATFAQRIQHLGLAVKGPDVHRQPELGGHLAEVVGGNAAVAAVGGGLIEQGQAAHGAGPQHRQLLDELLLGAAQALGGGGDQPGLGRL